MVQRSNQRSVYEKYVILKKLVKYMFYKMTEETVFENAKRYGLDHSTLISLNQWAKDRLPPELRLPDPVDKPDGIKDVEGFLRRIAEMTPYRGDLNEKVEIYYNGYPMFVPKKTALLLYLLDDERLVKIAEEIEI